jgi:hypothetical protein
MRTSTKQSGKAQRKLAAVLAVALIAMGAMVAPALAQSPGSGYDETGVMNNVPPGGGGVLGDQDSGAGDSPAAAPTPSEGTVPSNEAGTTSPAATTTGNLPFTGLDVGIVVLMSLALLGTGLLLRRSGRSQ